MSFNSTLEISVDEVPDLSRTKLDISRRLQQDGIAAVAYSDIEDAFNNGRGHFRLHSAYLLSLTDFIAELFPDLTMDARGLGEEFRHTWIAEYRNGKRVFSVGPWAYDEE